MAYPSKTRILFQAGNPAVDGGGSLRDHTTVHTSFQIDFNSKHPYKKLTIPIDNGLDKPVEVIVYGRTEEAGDAWHQLGSAITIATSGQAHATLTDEWKSIKMTVEVTGGVAATTGDFLAKMMPVVEG